MSDAVINAIIGVVGIAIGGMIGAFSTRGTKRIDSELEHDRLRDAREQRYNALVDELRKELAQVSERVAALNADLRICLADKERMSRDNARLSLEQERMQAEIASMREDIQKLL